MLKPEKANSKPIRIDRHQTGLRKSTMRVMWWSSVRSISDWLAITMKSHFELIMLLEMSLNQNFCIVEFIFSLRIIAIWSSVSPSSCCNYWEISWVFCSSSLSVPAMLVCTKSCPVSSRLRFVVLIELIFSVLSSNLRCLSWSFSLSLIHLFLQAYKSSSISRLSRTRKTWVKRRIEFPWPGAWNTDLIP